MSNYEVLLLMVFVPFVITCFIVIIFEFSRRVHIFYKECIVFIKRIKNNDDKHKYEYRYCHDDWNWYSVQMFRRKTNGNYRHYDFEGVYIVRNIDKNKCYVGQSINVIKRLRTHFNGRSAKGGADDLNNALINGDRLEIVFLELKGSSFRNLDDMESFFIHHFNSYYRGYNRTRGNNRINNIFVNLVMHTGYHANSFELD